MSTRVCCIVVAAALAVAAKGEVPPLPDVSPLHPRVYVRHDAARIGTGLTVSGLRRRAAAPGYARWRRGAPLEGAAGMVERAARYLESNSPDDLAAVRRFLLSHTFSLQRDDVGGLLAGAKMATAFDWVHDGLTEPERRAAMANIVATADSSRDFMLHGEPDVNHNYTYMALRTLAVCGLVLKGEPEPFDTTARAYLSLARSWIEDPGRVLDTWQAKEGAWAEGSHYTFHETLRTLIMMLHAYRTASGTDYLALIAAGHGNFLSGAGRYLIACTRPDLTFERLGDVLPSRAQAALTVPLTVEMLAAAVPEPEEAARFRSFAAELEEVYGDRAVLPQFDWGMRVFHDPGAERTPSYRTLPTALRLGRGTVEHIMLRSGWEPGSTLVSIIGGDHYTDHQHFDKGHFLVYHRGGLAVDGGTYDSMYRPRTHWTDYACRTVAHNALLIFDPRQELPPGYGNDGGQLVLRGLQHHADWQSWLSHARQGADGHVRRGRLRSGRAGGVRLRALRSRPRLRREGRLVRPAVRVPSPTGRPARARPRARLRRRFPETLASPFPGVPGGRRPSTGPRDHPVPRRHRNARAERQTVLARGKRVRI